VLLLFGEDQSFPMISALGRSIRSTLNSQSPNHIEFYTEYLDHTRIDDIRYEAELVNVWRKKYESHRIDLIIVCVASALDLLSQHRSDLFPGVPTVFCVLFEEQVSRLRLPPEVTGVWSAKPMRPTLELALRLHPGTRRVIVVFGSSEFEKEALEITRGELREFESQVEFDYLTDLTIDQLQERLASEPKDSIVLFGSFTRDAAGALYTGPQSVSRIAPTSTVPIYGLSSSYFGSGIVGGSLVSFENLGASAAEVGARILAGERSDGIRSDSVPNVVTLDWRELRRWGISVKSLPAGSTVLFQQETFLEQYRWYVAGAVALLICEALLIAALLANRARRLKAEKENAQLARLAQQEHRRLEEVVSNVPGIVWESKVEPGTGIRRIEFVSEYAEKMLGYPVEDWLSANDFWLSLVPQEDREKVAGDSERAFASGADSVIQLRLTAKDGRLLWAESHLAPILDEKGEHIGLRGVTTDITDRKLAEEARRHSEEKTRDILRALPDLIFLQSPDGIFLDYHADRTGDLFVPEGFLGRHMHEVLPAEVVDELVPLFQRARETGERQVLEYRLAMSGEERWFEARIVNSGDNLLSVVRDITDRKRAEAALRENRRQLAAIIESAMDAIISIDEDQRIVLMNAAAEKIFGCPAGQAIGQSIEQFIPERFRKVHKRHIQSFAKTRLKSRSAGFPRALFGRRVDGSEFPIEASISQVQLNGRKFFTIILRDITERKLAEQAIIDSEANYRSIFNAVNDAIFVHDTETGVIVDVNQVMCDMYGITLEEARGLAPDVLSADEPAYSREAALRWIKKAVEGTPQVFEWRAKDKAGRLFWVEVSLKRSVIGGKDRVLAVVRDITYRKQAQEALRESEERFRMMADTAPVMIWISGPDIRRTYFNQQWINFTGRTIQEEVGDGWIEGVHPKDVGRCLVEYRKAFDLREPFKLEYRIRRADGQFRWVYDSGTPRLSRSGKFLGYIGSCIDITERKAAEQALADLSGQLIRAREDECARIARELHDDLNQRMALVSVELEQLKQSPPETDAKLRRHLQGVMKQTIEISREIHRISYALHPSKLVHLGLVAAVKGLCEELRQNHGLKIDFAHENVPAAIPQDVSLCLYRIAQECLNNVVRHSGAHEARVELRGTDSHIRLRVSDSGSGFDVKSPSVRKGLGLLSMRERLRLVGGEISIESRPSHGTQVDASVPLTRAGVESEDLSEEQTRAATGVD
jgi:PAS domain S-box-containing protein